jgi:pyruvate,orthophosphate dikinase
MLKEAAEKAQVIAKELAETSAEVAKAGLAGLKAGLEEAKKVYNDNRNK